MLKWFQFCDLVDNSKTWELVLIQPHRIGTFDYKVSLIILGHYNDAIKWQVEGTSPLGYILDTGKSFRNIERAKDYVELSLKRFIYNLSMGAK